MKKKVRALIILLIGTLLLSGAGFSHNDSVIKTDEKPLYKVCTSEDMASWGSLEGRNVAFAAKVVSVENNLKKLKVSSENLEIEVNLKAKTSARAGDSVVVYGSMDSGKTCKITSGQIEVTKDTDLLGDFCFYHPTGEERLFYYEDDMVSHEVGGRIVYQTPASWDYVKSEDEKIFHPDLDGDCYFLNVLTGNKNTETFMVFFFDYNDGWLKYDSDKKETNGVERAIISNICKEEESELSWKGYKHFTFWANTEKSNNNGYEYKYYVGEYKDSIVEFVFKECSDGIAVMIYAYTGKTANERDVLYLLQTLEIK